MFVLNTLETIIKRRWIGMLGNEKVRKTVKLLEKSDEFYETLLIFQAEIRSQLNEFLLKRHDSIPPYIRNKAIKLIVDIAASDWPHFYPDFFTNLLEFLRRKDTLILGLNMLLITSEELATPR